MTVSITHPFVSAVVDLNNPGEVGPTDWNATHTLTGAAALTKVDDTNVTLTLGGTPNTALLEATSLTLGWTGTLSLNRLVQGTDGQLIVGQTSSAPQYKTITGDISVSAGGIASITPSITPTWTGLHTYTTTSGGINLLGFANTALVDSTLGLSTRFGILGVLNANSATIPEGVASFNIISGLGSGSPNDAFKIGLTASATSNSGSANSWAQSNVMNLNAGGTKRGGIALELDLNNNWGDYTGSPAVPYATNLMIAGTNTGGYAHAGITIQFAGNANPMWNYGISLGVPGFKVFNTATLLDESDAPTSVIITGTHVTNVIDLSGASTSGYQIKAKGHLVDAAGNMTIGAAGLSTGAIGFAGTTSGGATVKAQDAAGSPILTLPNTTGTFAVTASAPLSLDTTTGNLSLTVAYLPLAGGTMVGNLIFTDATYDIGASGATRPRNIFLSSDATIGGAITATSLNLNSATLGSSKFGVSGTSIFHVGTDLNLLVQNTSSTVGLAAANDAINANVAFSLNASTVNVTTLSLTVNGSLVVSSSALATNATDGFLYIPTCAGTPTGVPTAFTGRSALVYDSTNNKLYIYNSSWKKAQVTAVDAVYG